MTNLHLTEDGTFLCYSCKEILNKIDAIVNSPRVIHENYFDAFDYKDVLEEIRETINEYRPIASR